MAAGIYPIERWCAVRVLVHETGQFRNGPLQEYVLVQQKFDVGVLSVVSITIFRSVIHIGESLLCLALGRPIIFTLTLVVTFFADGVIAIQLPAIRLRLEIAHWLSLPAPITFFSFHVIMCGRNVFWAIIFRYI